jgi:hypothetical protein
MYRAGPVPPGTGRTGPVPTGSVNFALDYILTNFFYLYFLITVIYSVVARTKRMKCQNK